MILAVEKAKDDSITMVEGNASNDDHSCAPCTKNDLEEQNAKPDTPDASLINQKADDTLIRETAASIANALLRLGSSEDNSDNSSTSSSTHSIKNRKRAVSVVADTDASSTCSQTTDAEADIPACNSPKRQRTSRRPSKVICSIPTKLCLLDSSKNSLHDEEDQSTSFSTSEFLLQHQNFNEPRAPGDIGCISQFFHQDFRPLQAAPRLPRTIVPETPPPLPMMHSPYTPAPPAGTMYSTAITEHNDCVVMHSYTVLPRAVPQRMAQLQF